MYGFAVRVSCVDICWSEVAFILVSFLSVFTISILFTIAQLMYTVFAQKFVILISIREKVFVQVYSNSEKFPVSLISAI